MEMKKMKAGERKMKTDRGRGKLRGVCVCGRERGKMSCLHPTYSHH